MALKNHDQKTDWVFIRAKIGKDTHYCHVSRRTPHEADGLLSSCDSGTC